MEARANIRTVCTGQFTLPLPVAASLPLFTPEGERRWAGASWDPVYPVADAARDDSAPGTVFTTDSDGGPAAVWIVVDRRQDGMRYARIVPDRIAGTVEVSCAATGSADVTRVTVTYDVTSLSHAGAEFVDELSSNFDAFLEHWREHILAAAGGAE
jgi:hypothetical protein